MFKFKLETELKKMEIPKVWVIKKIKEVAEVFKNPHCPPGKNTYSLTQRAIMDFSILKNEIREVNTNKRNVMFLKRDDIVINSQGEGTLGRCGFISEDLIETYNDKLVSDGLITVVRSREINAKYLYYLLSSNFYREYIDSRKVGSTGQTSISPDEIMNLTIFFPSIKDQLLVASILSFFDDLISNKKKQNEILEKTAMSIFKNYFVDFNQSNEGKFVHNEELEMEIPENWEVKPIGKIATLENGIPYSGEEKVKKNVEGSYIFITLNNAVEGGGFKTEYSWIKSDRLKDSHFLYEGDLIITNVHFGVGGSAIGRLLATPALVNFPEDYKQERGVYSMDITKFSPFEKEYKPYLYLYLKFTKEDSVSFSTGTSILHLDIENFKQNKMVLCPPKKILEKFNSIIQPIFQKIVINQKQIMTLTDIRDTFLPFLVFGKLKVEEI